MNSYEVFVTVVESGNFSLAAKSLGVTTSAISKKISRLENRIGVRLLARTTRSLSMTKSGEFCYERYREVLSQITEMEDCLGSFQKHPAGVLKVTCTPAFADGCLIGLLSDFRAEYPDITLDVRSSEKFEDIVGEGIDIAIREGDLLDISLTAQKLSTYRLVTCASPEYLRGKELQTMDDVLKEQLILIDRSKVIKGLFSMFPVFTESVILRLSYMSAIRNALLSGLGISFVPEYLVADDIAKGHLIELGIDNKIPHRDIHAVFSANRPVPAKTKAFVTFLADNLDRFAA